MLLVSLLVNRWFWATAAVMKPLSGNDLGKLTHLGSGSGYFSCEHVIQSCLGYCRLCELKHNVERIKYGRF